MNLKKDPFFNKKNAKSYGAMGGKKKGLVYAEKKKAMESIQMVLASKMPIEKGMKETLDFLGIDVRGKITVATAIAARVIQNTINDGDAKALETILKACGMHFDQTKGALGGRDNPLCVNQNTSEMLKGLTDEQLTEIANKEPNDEEEGE
ncbi:MAG: hypothetical protein WCR96_07020 [Candidatus Methanomethylophilaceae archaeon]